MKQTFSASLFSKHPTGNPRYRPGDIVKTTRRAVGTHAFPGRESPLMLPLAIPAGSIGTISEIAAFRPDESFPPRWIYRVRFPGTGETRYWIRGSVLRLVERNPKIAKVKNKAKTKGGKER